MHETGLKERVNRSSVTEPWSIVHEPPGGGQRDRVYQQVTLLVDPGAAVQCRAVPAMGKPVLRVLSRCVRWAPTCHRWAEGGWLSPDQGPSQAPATIATAAVATLNLATEWGARGEGPAPRQWWGAGRLGRRWSES